MRLDNTPEFGKYSGLKKFKGWIQKALPQVYDDALSYQELIYKLMYWVNTLIDDVNMSEENLEALRSAYQELQEWCDEYFENLDAEAMMDERFDELVADGTIATVLENVYGTEIYPVVVSSTSQMTDKTRSYVLSSDEAGVVWFWTGSEWSASSICMGTEGIVYEPVVSLMGYDFETTISSSSEYDQSFPCYLLAGHTYTLYVTSSPTTVNYYISGDTSVTANITSGNSKTFTPATSGYLSFYCAGTGTVIGGVTGSWSGRLDTIESDISTLESTVDSMSGQLDELFGADAVSLTMTVDGTNQSTGISLTAGTTYTVTVTNAGGTLYLFMNGSTSTDLSANLGSNGTRYETAYSYTPTVSGTLYVYGTDSATITISIPGTGGSLTTLESRMDDVEETMSELESSLSKFTGTADTVATVTIDGTNQYTSIYLTAGESYDITIGGDVPGALYLFMNGSTSTDLSANLGSDSTYYGSVYNYSPTVSGYLCVYGNVSGNVITITIPGSEGEIEERISALESQSDSTLDGVKWVAIGDSNTATDTLGANNNYVYFIAEITGASWTNLGISGSGFLASPAYYQRISSIPTNTQLITVMASTNDYGYMVDAMGEWGDTTNDTVYGAMYYFFEQLFARCPDAVVLAYQPFPQGAHWLSGAQEAYIEPYCDAFEKTCKYFNVPLLDLCHESGLRPYDETFRTNWYKGGADDVIHPNAEAHKRFIVPKVLAHMKANWRNYD